MQVVNDEFVPALKILNQADSSFFLLESDLDKSLEEGILRSKDGSIQILQSRFEMLNKLVQQNHDENLSTKERVAALQGLLIHLSDLLDAMYKDWPNRDGYTASVSAERNQFRLQLKMLIRDLEREIRLSSIGVQNDISRSGIVVTLLLALCIISAFLLSYWISSSLEPLAALTKQMQEISELGLELVPIPDSVPDGIGSDEVSVLAKEFHKMSSFVLDKTRQLNFQKKNLESAHLEMAKQNVALRKAQVRLSQSEKLSLVGRLSAQMAHEIRNPLNALGLHVELLDEQLKRSGSLITIDPIRKEIDRLMNVSKSYLDLARAPKIEPTKENLNDLVEELQELYAPLLAEKKITLVCDLGLLPAINIDRAQFSQVLGNLLKNAVEAIELSNKKKKIIRLETEYDEEKSSVCVRVSDTGIGMEREQKEAIFTPFFTSKSEGTGLGLVFSKQVIESHGGEISFETEKNLGTKFILRIPLS